MLRGGRWGSALSWAIRSRDIEIVSTVADQVVSRCAPDQFSSITVVEHFTEVMLLSSSFVFLHRYYKFRKLLESDQKVKAAELLVCCYTVIHNFNLRVFVVNIMLLFFVKGFMSDPAQQLRHVYSKMQRCFTSSL